MDRKQEYQALLNELETPNLREKDSLRRAISRRRREQWLWRPTIGVVAACLSFVILVNFNAGVAEACSKVPVLRELAAAVTFHRSLQVAVEHDYVQEVYEQQSQNGVTLTVEYLIADQKQLNVFYRVTDAKNRALEMQPALLDVESSEPLQGVVSQYDMDEDAELHFVRLDMVDLDVPTEVLLEMQAQVRGAEQDETAATFAIRLQVDPSKIAPVKGFELDRVLELDGQRLTLSRVELYPTQLRLLVKDDAANSAWLRGLDFTLTTDAGAEFSTVHNGVTATGDADEPKMVSFRADSPYFYEAESLTLQVTGARWLDKSMQQVRVDLAAKEAELPEGVELVDVSVVDGSRRVVVRVQELQAGTLHEVFFRDYYDANGTEYRIGSMMATPRYEALPINEGWFYQYFDLDGYEGNLVWLSPTYSHASTEEVELVIELK
jgi:ethanolamine utilization protein EutP (predicted NTPase)